MKRLIIVICVIIVLGFTQDMIVRVYVPSWEDLSRLLGKNLDIAAGNYGEWYDLVVDHEGLNKVIASGVTYEVIIYSLEHEKEKVRGHYLSYAEINDSLTTLAQNYPSICKFDSLPIQTYEGRWIYGVKISDNVQVEEDEPKFTLDGCHHSREWACPQAVLFFADSMLVSYGTVPEIAEIINTTEIYCWPLINVDGYVYDYPTGRMWRKNREPFGGSIGADPNRNYGGGCTGEKDGYWGAADEGECSHYPSGQTFPGAYPYSGDEIQAYTAFIRAHKVTTGISLHSYGQQVMWPWGFKAEGTPDATLYNTVGTHMASMMQRLSGGGTYTPGQSHSNPYPTVGNTRDWVYGYNKWIAGLSALFYGSEIGTSFYQPIGDLDNISLQVFKAAKYLAGYADSLILVAEGFVPPCPIYPIGSVNQDFTIYWHAKNSYDNHPTHWELVEFSNPTIVEDDLESGTGRWILDGFTLSTAQSHSATHSFFSGNTNRMNSVVQTVHPYVVQPGDSVTFWCWYDLETNYDVALIEVSENGREWFCADTMRYSGSSSGWVRKAFSLASWVGKSVYIRFRSMTDSNTLDVGFYVDDISPVCLFANVDTISSSINDTSYAFTGHAVGEYYYYVKGYNTPHGWGTYSCLEKADVVSGIAEPGRSSISPQTPDFAVYPNPFQRLTSFIVQLPNSDAQATISVYDASGKLVRQWNDQTLRLTDHISWDGTDHVKRPVPAGVYFVRFETEDYNKIEKAILIR